MANIEQLTWVFNTRDAASSQNEKIAKSLKNVEQAQNLVTKASGGIQKAFSGIAKEFAIGTLAANAVTGAFNFVKNSISNTFAAAVESNRVMSQTEAVIKSTGGVAGMTAKSISGLAAEFQKTTNYEDDATQSAENILLTFRGIGKDVFPQTTQAVLDMSTAMRLDLNHAALMVGKALQDPTRGITALRRQGVAFTKEEQELINQLVKTGNAAKAQAMILKELNTEFGGSAKAAVDADGGLKQLGNTFSDVQEEVGKAVIDSTAFREIISSMKATITDPAFIEGAATTVKGIMSVVLGLANALKTAWSGISWFLETSGREMRNNALTQWAMLTIDSLKGLLEVMGGLHAEIEDIQMGGIVREAGQLQIVTTKFRDMRDALGLTGDELKKIRGDFQNIEDPGIRMSKMMQAIRDGKYDTDARKLSVAYKDWNEKLKESRDKISSVGAQVKKENPEFANFMATLGLVSENGTKKLNQEVGFLTTALVGNSKAVEDNWKIIETNKSTLDSTTKKVNELIKSYKDVPAPLKTISDRLKDLNFKKFEEQEATELQIDFEKEMNGILEKGDIWLRENIGSTEGLVIESKKLADYQRTKGIPAFVDFNDVIEALSGAVDSITGTLSGLGVISEGTARKVGGITSGISNIGAGAESVKKSGGGIIGTIGKVAGSFGIVGAAISVATQLLSLFAGKSGELEAAERRLKGLAGVSGEWAKKIEELGKSLKGAGADRAFNEYLHEIIGSTNITIDNFDTWIGKVREIVSSYEQGFASIDETSKNFGDAFSAMLSKAKDLGLEGGAAMTGLIIESKEFGLQCKSIADYVKNNMTDAAEGWVDVMETFGNVEMPGMENWIAQIKILEDISKPLKQEIEGVTKSLIGQSNAGRLTEQQFQLYEDVLADINKKLGEQGYKELDLVNANLPMLQRLYFLHQQYGYQLDAETEKLIELGLKNGLITEESTEKKREEIDVNEEMLAVLQEIRDMFGKKLPDAVGAFGDSLDNVNGKIVDAGDNISGIKVSGGPGFATGTPSGGFTVPAGFPNDNFPIRVSSGELVQVTPPGQVAKFNPAQSIYYYTTNITNYITIYGAEGGDSPQSLADKMIYVVKYNVHSFNNELARKVA